MAILNAAIPVGKFGYTRKGVPGCEMLTKAIEHLENQPKLRVVVLKSCLYGRFFQFVKMIGKT